MKEHCRIRSWIKLMAAIKASDPLLSVLGAKTEIKTRFRIRSGLPCGRMARANTDAVNAIVTSKLVLTVPPNVMMIDPAD